MKIAELPQCKKIESFNIHNGSNIHPLDRLKIMGDSEFEDLVLEWANGYIKNNYYKVSTMAGSGDKGRDIVAYYDDRKYDIYQCKHYSSPLSPSNYWIEFGKLCYYTYNKDYEIPRKYYIVASNGIGQALRDLVDKPSSINQGLIDSWDKHCKKKITQNQEIILDGKFLEYIKKFDFSIVNDIPPINLIEQYSTTVWYKFRFGGGIKKREKPDIPLDISIEEEEMNYVKELLQVYSEKNNTSIVNIENLRNEVKSFNHFVRQREDFYFAQSLKRFSRDEYIDTEPFDDIKREVYKGVIDCFEDEYNTNYKKVNEVLKVARSIYLESEELGDIKPSEKSGICHEMVNEGEISWVDENE
ncbi:MAG: ABC-three component system protein [Paraclostridium sp.]